MKKSIIAVTALLCLGVPGVAVADEATDVLQARVADLKAKVADRDQRLEHKSAVLACERANRRALERALRTDSRVVLVRPCR